LIPPLLQLLKIPNSVSKKNVLPNGLLAKKTLNASLPFKTARRNVALNPHAGPYVFQEKEAKLLLTLPSALKPMDALEWFLLSNHV
jgi:4-hydroxy-L-threonine phosphate dehydrogenase PdxA